MDFFSLRGPPAYYTSIGLGPWGGTPTKSAPRQVFLFIYALSGVTMLTTRAGHSLLNYATREAFRLRYYAIIIAAILYVNEISRNLIIIGRALKHSISYLECFFTVMISLLALPFSAEVNIALYAACVYFIGEFHIRSLHIKYQLALKGFPFIFIINTFPAGAFRLAHNMPSR
jgi:hypothetical protein